MNYTVVKWVGKIRVHMYIMYIMLQHNKLLLYVMVLALWSNAVLLFYGGAGLQVQWVLVLVVVKLYVVLQSASVSRDANWSKYPRNIIAGHIWVAGAERG